MHSSALQAREGISDVDELDRLLLGGQDTTALNIPPEARDTEVDKQSLEVAIENHLKERKKGAKNKRFFYGVLAGTTTGGAAKILSGLALFFASLYNLNNPAYSICQDNPTVFINNTDNFADMMERRYIIDFGSVKNHSFQANESDSALWFLTANRICSKQNPTSLKGIYITGIISGIIMVGSFYDKKISKN